MKKSILFLSVAFLAHFISAQTAELRTGTPIQVVITTPVSSENNENVIAIVGEDVRAVNGEVIVREGETVLLDVQKTYRKGIGRQGMIDVHFISTTTVNGQAVLLNGSKHQEGMDKKGLVLGVGIGAGVFFWPMFFFLTKRGGEAFIPINTVVATVSIAGTYYFNSDK